MKTKFLDKVLTFANSLAGDYYSKDQKFPKGQSQKRDQVGRDRKTSKKDQQSFTGSEGADVDVSYGNGI